MPSALRERIKGLPFFGPLLYGLYMKLRYREGEVLEIQGGRLEKMKMIRFMRSYHPSYIQGTYEPVLQNAIADGLTSGGIFFDVGSNAGYFALLGASIVGASGKVVAYEPHPVTAGQIRRQLKCNQLDNCIVVEAAMSEAVGEATFADDRASDMVSLASVRSDTPARTITVQTTTLDAEVSKHGVPDVIKIDIEGAEIMALRGGMKLLREHDPLLLVERHSKEIADEYDMIMRECGYESTPLAVEEARIEGFARLVSSRKMSR